MKMMKAMIAAAVVAGGWGGMVHAQFVPPNSNAPIYHSSITEALTAAGLDVYVNDANTAEIEAFGRNKPKVQVQAGDAFAGGWIHYDTEK